MNQKISDKLKNKMASIRQRLHLLRKHVLSIPDKKLDQRIINASKQQSLKLINELETELNTLKGKSDI
jgi:hypothetical protein